MWTKRHRHGSARMMAYVREKVSRRPKFRRFLSLANAGCQRQAVSEIPPNAGWNTLMYLGIFIFDPCWSILIHFYFIFFRYVLHMFSLCFPPFNTGNVWQIGAEVGSLARWSPSGTLWMWRPRRVRGMGSWVLPSGSLAEGVRLMVADEWSWMILFFFEYEHIDENEGW